VRRAQGGLEDTVDPRIEVVELSPPLPRSLTSRLRLGPAMAPYVERLAPDVIFLPGNFHFPLVPALAGARTRGAGGQDLEPGGAFRAGGSAGALAVPPLSPQH
jgi:hypothetical protein